jgi:hypothetical protein
MEYKGICWPTKEQKWLLRAALLQGNAAIAAWREWESNVDIDRLDRGSQRLLPLLYHNLREQGVETPLMGKLKGVYRATWYKNQLAFHDMAALLNVFHAAGIQTMILKEAALILLHYQDHGLRPMDKFDILVRPEQASAAINLLVELGWRPKKKSLEAFNDSYFSFRHEHAFENAAGHQFDLHWHVLHECCYTNADDDFWDSAIVTELRDVSTQALNPTDQLLHVCVHGVKWNPTPLLCWIADATMILNASQSEIDWNRLITQAQKLRLILPIKAALNYLRDLLNIPVPPVILQSMQDMPVSTIERMEHEACTRSPGLMGGLPQSWFRYLRFSQLESVTSLRPKLFGFPKFLQQIWTLDHLWQVPFYAVSKASKRIQAKLFRANQRL